MAPRAVDVVAPAGLSADPYAPGATAWAIAGALAARGDSVSVLYPAGPEGSASLADVRTVPVELPLRHPGAPAEGAELATAAGRHLRREADVVIRDPVGLGRLGLPRGRGPVVAGFVRGVELTAYDHDRPGGSAGFRDRLDRWRDRRAVRRLEEAALRDADRLFCDAPGLPRLLHDVYGVAESRCQTALPPVAGPSRLPTLEEARSSFHIPNDVPVVVAPAAFDGPEPSGTDRAREAFRRVRSFFPGARLLITGASAPADAHATVVPDRDVDSLVRALVAADVAIFARRVPGFDPGAVLALRASRAVIAGPSVVFPADPGEAVRRVADDDPGELASALAELLADPAVRRPLAAAGQAYAARYDPDRVVAEFSDSLGRIGAAPIAA